MAWTLYYACKIENTRMGYCRYCCDFNLWLLHKLSLLHGMRILNAPRNQLCIQWGPLRHWSFCFLLFSSLLYITPCETSKYFLKKSSANSSNLTYSAPSLYAADMPLTQASSCMFYGLSDISTVELGFMGCEISRILLCDVRDLTAKMFRCLAVS